ncbi:hypothetical protein ABE30_14645 [Bacillus tropicus]|nr:hypothetical protein [Bacillus tropicus]MBG9918808.1 hypothetical protein [Bacillus tropicus]MBG9938120.1 hypothetical protein [Bacillus tropicus]
MSFKGILFLFIQPIEFCSLSSKAEILIIYYEDVYLLYSYMPIVTIAEKYNKLDNLDFKL